MIIERNENPSSSKLPTFANVLTDMPSLVKDARICPAHFPARTREAQSFHGHFLRARIFWCKSAQSSGTRRTPRCFRPALKNRLCNTAKSGAKSR
jgi:hypothetical protein